MSALQKWSHLWVDAGIQEEPTEHDQMMSDIGIEYAVYQSSVHPFAVHDNGEMNTDLASTIATCFEISFGMARHRWSDEVVAARLLEAVAALDDASLYPSEAILMAARDGYQFGVRLIGNSDDAIWLAWSVDPRSIKGPTP